MYRERLGRHHQSNKTSIAKVMSFEELLQEHIKALHENTKALNAYTKALQGKGQMPEDIEHTKDSACKFCGVSYKTFQTFIANGEITPCRRNKGTREYFKESDLNALCIAKQLRKS